jgi:hypothetical protein
LVLLLRVIGIRDGHQVAAKVHGLLEGRDPVTDVLTAVAFTQAGVDQPTESAELGCVAGEIVRGFDNSTRNLFREHLCRRFAPRDALYKKRLAAVCQAAGWEIRELAADSAGTGSAARSTESSPREKKSSILGNWLHWLAGPSESEVRPTSKRGKNK